MNDKIGLMKKEIRLVKKDDELINRVVASNGIFKDPKEVAQMLRYNVFTVKQFSDLTGLAQSTILNKCRPIYREGNLVTDLDFCHPFADLDGMGPKFIIRNDKSESLLP